jgi:hypothetical protein
VAAVEGLGVNAIELPHAAREVPLWGLEEEVVMVVHEAIGVAAEAVAFHHLGEDFQKREPVLVSEEDGLSGVSPGGDVIQGSRELHPQWSGHGPLYHPRHQK